MAIETADALCRLQGPAGQWWWIYDVERGTPAIRYPVYSIHQDAMGPMALLAVSLASEHKRDYTDAIWKSLNGFTTVLSVQIRRLWITMPELYGEPSSVTTLPEPVDMDSDWVSECE